MSAEERLDDFRDRISRLSERHEAEQAEYEASRADDQPMTPEARGKMLLAVAVPVMVVVLGVAIVQFPDKFSVLPTVAEPETVEGAEAEAQALDIDWPQHR